MDDVVIHKRSDAPTAGMYFAVLAAVWAICTAAGIRLAPDLGMKELAFYGRYDGMAQADAGMAAHLTEAVVKAVPCLGSLSLLFLLSFSPLLFPASAIVIGFRGFMLGTAFSLAGDFAAAAQLGVYAVCTAIGCGMASFILAQRHDHGGSAFGRIKAFLAASGGCVICEVLLSFIL